MNRSLPQLALALCLTILPCAYAQPTTQPAEKAAEKPINKPVEIKGVVIAAEPIKTDDIKLAVRSIRHQISYDIVNGTLVPSANVRSAAIRYEVVFPAGVTRASHRTELLKLEDDHGEDRLRSLRDPEGVVRASTIGSTFNVRAGEPTALNMFLPNFPAPPRSIGRVAGRITLSIPLEVSNFDMPLAPLGATATITDTTQISVTSTRVVENNSYEVKVAFKTLAGNPADIIPRPPMNFIGISPNGTEMGTMSISIGTAGATIFFPPGTDKHVEKLRITTTTKILEVPLEFDLRPQPMM